eukprot:bmy_21941T0
MSPESKKLFNIIILGIAFMFMFTAFQTCGNVAYLESDFLGMAIIYGVFSASNLITPSVVAIVGPQLSMFASGLFYSMYIAVFIQPFPWSFYTASVFIGIAAAVLWTAQGNCLTINSDEHTIGRNSGIFWALLQSSLFFGNLYIYFAWQGKTQISESDRRTVFIALTVISLVGTVLFFLIRKPDSENVLGEDESSDDQDLDVNESAQNNMTKAVDAFSLELTFFSGVYGTCIGAINKFGTEEKSLIGLSGIFIGIGEILDPQSKSSSAPHTVFASPIVSRPEFAGLRSKEVAIFCSFLLGLGDSCFNTQLLSILGFLYSEDSAPAFAVFKFVQSICAAVAFFYSNYLLLHWQLLVMVIFGFFGTVSFFTVEWEAAAIVARGSDYRSI